ncbi:MAG: dUTP diphosphatase, partial [Tetragenococcus koreensis]
MKKRGFEIVTEYINKEIHLPQRATHHSAGY